MSPQAEDSDPLLAFTNEAGAAPLAGPPPDTATQPVASAEDARREARSAEFASLTARVDQLERALEKSNQQVLSLKSEVATLVRAVADNKATSPSGATPARAPRSAMRAVVALIGVVIGFSLGLFAWMSLTGDADVSMAASPPESTPPPSPDPPHADPPPAVIAPVVLEQPKASTPTPIAPPAKLRAPAPKTPKAPQAVQASQASQAPRYVGALYIDASPGGEVFVDRQSAGNTPVRLTNLRAGSHLIWVERNGYRRFTRVVQVPADQVTRVFADLEPIAQR